MHHCVYQLSICIIRLFYIWLRHAADRQTFNRTDKSGRKSQRGRKLVSQFAFFADGVGDGRPPVFQHG